LDEWAPLSAFEPELGRRRVGVDHAAALAAPSFTAAATLTATALAAPAFTAAATLTATALAAPAFTAAALLSPVAAAPPFTTAALATRRFSAASRATAALALAAPSRAAPTHAFAAPPLRLGRPNHCVGAPGLITAAAGFLARATLSTVTFAALTLAARAPPIPELARRPPLPRVFSPDTRRGFLSPAVGSRHGIARQARLGRRQTRPRDHRPDQRHRRTRARDIPPPNAAQEAPSHDRW
jgi:hypothetical protein